MADASINGKASIGSLCAREPDYGVSSRAVERTDESQPKYIRITDFTDDGIERNHTFVAASDYSEKNKLHMDDILFARTGATVGKTYYYDGEIGDAIFAGYCIRFRIDPSKAIPKYVYWYTKTITFQCWVNSIQRPSGQPNINKEEYKAHLIPIPGLATQNRLVAFMDSAAQQRREKLREAEELLAGMSAYVSVQLALPKKPTKNIYGFGITRKALQGVIDPKRHLLAALQTSFTISDICTILDEKVNPSTFGDATIDWIRIDDLPNRPWDIEETRTQPANEVTGTFFEVQPNDILVARLGPTLLNQKIVIVRSTARTTIASSEFLVLRCKPNISPEALMWVLRTEYYKELMHSHTRGSTPSRYRLNRDDMLNLPFPQMEPVQDSIEKEAHRRRDNARTLRSEADSCWAAAKAAFEKNLLEVEA